MHRSPPTEICDTTGTLDTFISDPANGENDVSAHRLIGRPAPVMLQIDRDHHDFGTMRWMLTERLTPWRAP